MSKYVTIHFKVGKDEVFSVSVRYSQRGVFRVEDGQFVLNRYVDNFETSASRWHRNRIGIKDSGQCQEEVLPSNSIAMEFFKKWKPMHQKALTEEQYSEMISDLEELKKEYSYGENERSVVMTKTKKTSK